LNFKNSFSFLRRVFRIPEFFISEKQKTSLKNGKLFLKIKNGKNYKKIKKLFKDL